MRKIFYLICIAIIMGGCAVNPRPSWIATGERHLERFKNSFLTYGHGELAERHFMSALEEIKKSGNLDLIEKAWLTRMALQVAVLEEMDEKDYLETAAVRRVPENGNFYIFLKGDISEVEIKDLPEQYGDFGRALFMRDVLKSGKAMEAIKDEPVSRLIAAGIAVKSGIESETIIQTAVNTASVNGWKAALIIWLERLAAFYDAAGEGGKAGDVRRRIELIK